MADTIILAAAVASFFVLFIAWVGMPHGASEQESVAVRASAVKA
jgi:hypothetical protein